MSRISRTCILAGVLLGCASAQRGCPLQKATSAFFLTSERYDDSVDILFEHSGLTPRSTPLFCNAPRGGCNATARFRSYDGSCTNADLINKPLVGARHQCHRRILPSIYVDGISQPPNRPNVVTIYNALQGRPIPLNYTSENAVNGLFPLIFQFVAHDITQTAIANLVDFHKKFDCCNFPHKFLPQCSMRVDVRHAIGYKDVEAKCMSFIRSSRCPCDNNMERQSMNQQTAHIDLSHVYGDGSQRNESSMWRLTSTEPTVSGALPLVNSDPPVCYGSKCFKGDGRINQQQGISLYHTVFERLHNQIADALNEIRPDNWTDDDVFQQARKLTIARYQYMVVSDLTGVLIDEGVLQEYKLDLPRLMNGTDVDPAAEAVTFAESVHAQFRLHGLVSENIDGEPFHWLNSSYYFKVDDFARRNAIGQWKSRGKQQFPFAEIIADEFLQYPDVDKKGLSMLLINIQRSRDTGLASWVDMVKWANGSELEINSFDDVKDMFTPSDLEMLRTMYDDNVSEVDLFVGGHLQLTHGTGATSFVFQKIHAHQLYGQVYGDRFFFSHKNVFTPEQRDAIAQSSSVSQILCETLQLDEVPEKPLIFSSGQKMLRCEAMKKIDYSLFFE